MKILVAHSFYKSYGGEDAVVKSEVDLLSSNGVSVFPFYGFNDELDNMSLWGKVSEPVWSASSYKEMRDRIKKYRPDVVHVHNTFPRMSPAIYWAASSLSVPIVQTFHNFRFFCLQAMFMRNGAVCEDCVGSLPWRGVVHGCYRGSVAYSAGAFSVTALHRFLGTYEKNICRYIVLNDFCRSKFEECGIDGKKINIKPNFVSDPCIGRFEGDRFLYVGRLSAEKGISVLAQAMAMAGDIEIDVIGDGGEAKCLHPYRNVFMHGHKDADYVIEKMRSAIALVVPSIWYENFPRIIVEAYSVGLPVIASRIGALADLVHDGETGLLCNPGDAVDFAEKIRWLHENPGEALRMGLRAREVYEKKYTAKENFLILESIYNEAIACGN